MKQDFANVEVRIFLKEEEKEFEEEFKNKIFSLFEVNKDDFVKVDFENSSKEDKSFYNFHSNNIEHFKFKKFHFFRSISKGFENKNIIFLNFVEKNSDNVNRVLENIIKNLSEKDFEKLILTSDTRIDDNNKFFLRLDKKAFLEDNFLLSDSGSVVHFSFHIITYPKSKVEALKKIISLMKSFRE